MKEIHIEDTHFKDGHGRTLMLRGVNLGGSSKVPARPNGATHIREGFYDHRDVSFVGRPFPLEEADEHFARLQAWGFNFLRFLVTWEAIEHAGPGIYDEAYLDYLYEIVRKAGEHDIRLFIDPHQDVWSRFSGGDGAPGWTFEVVGMDPMRFSEAGAAIVHNVHGDPFPRMIWPTNYSKLAAATMFTLFFGGDHFAPRTMVDGEPVQHFLQHHYIEAVKRVAHRLQGLPNVVGYETMNEPSPGFIGWKDADALTRDMLRLGPSPTPYESMLLGAGFPQEVEVWSLGLLGSRRRGRRLVNPDGVRVWEDGGECLWSRNGVWDVHHGVPRLLRPDHFARVGGRRVDFANDYLRPFIDRFTREIRSVAPEAIIFVEGVPDRHPPLLKATELSRVVNAPHWYDAATLFLKRFIPFLGVDIHHARPIFGPRRVQRAFVEQLARIKRWARKKMGHVPTLIGEFGIPFDMSDGRAYRNGDFSAHVQALDSSFRAVEANLLNCTLWNYTADNDNRHGDQWNGEDLSIFSRDQQDDPADIHSGGRALKAVVRPYPRRIAGEPLRLTFDVRKRAFLFRFRHDPDVSAPTEIFVPNYQYPDGYRVEVSDGTYEVDRENQCLIYRHSARREIHRIRVRPYR